MIERKNIQVWIKLSKSDLDSAKILYRNKHYRTSYFLFQQAVEKANKAFSLMGALFEEDDLKKMQHDPLKIYRKAIVNNQKETGELISVIEMNPVLKEHKLMNLNQLKSHQQTLIDYLRGLDVIRSLDLVNVSSRDLNHLYNELLNLKDIRFKKGKRINRIMKEQILQMKDLAEKIDTPEAREIEKDCNDWLSDPNKIKEISKLTVKYWGRYMRTGFVGQILYICAILTIQHSTLTRYPNNGLNPLEIYTDELPLVKKQPLFMELLADSLTEMKRILRILYSKKIANR